MKYLTLFLVLTSLELYAQPTHLVISQAYGGGGNTGAAFSNDFIEIFNPSASAVNLAGHSIQYSSAAGSTWSNIVLSGQVNAHSYFLIQLSGGSIGAALPSPDLTATLNLSATSGKIALVFSASPISGTCPSSSAILDFLGFGTSSCFETQAAPAGSNTMSITRKGAGCFDTNNNLTDFISTAPIPKNSGSPVLICGSTISLPIVFSNIYALKQEGKTTLYFTNEVENEVLYYVIEQSIDGYQFNFLQKIEPLHNNGNKVQYSSSLEAAEKVRHFRVKGLEENGTITFSKVIRVPGMDEKLNVTLFPNPARDLLTLKAGKLAKGDFIVSIYNIMEINLFNRKLSHNGGSLNMVFNVTNLPPGKYFITLRGDFTWKGMFFKMQ